MNVIREIERFLGGPNPRAEALARYIGARIPKKRKADEQSKLVYWGHSVPIHRDAADKKYSHSGLSDEKQWSLWIKIWKTSEVYDVKSIALVWLGGAKRKPLRLRF